MRLDHIAYRVADKEKTAQFFIDFMGYKKPEDLQEGFEIFISNESPGSIVEQWVQNKGGIGGIHHIAYQVTSVEAVVEEWRSKGFAEFASEEPLTCPGLVQIFTKPLAHTGVIYEFIERTTQGFCAKNVKNLMNSTKDNKF